SPRAPARLYVPRLGAPKYRFVPAGMLTRRAGEVTGDWEQVTGDSVQGTVGKHTTDLWPGTPVGAARVGTIAGGRYWLITRGRRLPRGLGGRGARCEGCNDRARRHGWRQRARGRGRRRR